MENKQYSVFLFKKKKRKKPVSNCNMIRWILNITSNSWIVIFSLALFGENPRYCYIEQKLWNFVIPLSLLKIFTWNSEYVFAVQRAIHTIKEDNSKCIFSELCRFFDMQKKLTFCKISIITEDIYLKLRICVFYPKSDPYYQGRQFKILFFFQNYAPFST